MSHSYRALCCMALIGFVACSDEPPTAVSPIEPSAPAPNADLRSAIAMLGRPLPMLTAAQRMRFEGGRAVFQIEFTPETGLGPLFNAVGCAACHEEPVVGGGGGNEEEEGGEDVEIHATAFHAGARCEDLAAVGGQVIQKQVTPALGEYYHIVSEAIPAAATDSGHRSTPDLFGFGLLDAVSDAEIMKRADPLDRDGDGISGRPNRTADGRLGRFGRKAQAATLREFNGEAFVMEMGVTNPNLQVEQLVAADPMPPGIDPLPEPEITLEQFNLADAFVRFLAPPPRERLDAVGALGATVFKKIGCASCHAPVLFTGANPVAALRFRAVPAFTDLLLHDMGPDLADICLGQARPSEFRTEPLMGLRFVTAFLHDGRAESIEEAIELHGGEGQRARNRFLRLSTFERRALLRFLRSL